ncbi:hypothetical protein RB601_002205 [Gaeumannomyces tritici]
MPPPLTVLPASHPKYEEYKAKFKAGWQHPGRSGKLKAIYYVRKNDLQASHRGKRFAAAWRTLGGDAEDLFHGTQRSCYIGEDSNNLEPCSSSDCHVCGILRDSFKLGKAHSGGMFGPGVYSTETTSKADIYAQNSHVRSRKHVIIVCRVITSCPQYLKIADHSRTGPDSGHNCVKAVTKANGGSVEYPETIVYQEDYIVPVAILVYEREGWQPRLNGWRPPPQPRRDDARVRAPHRPRARAPRRPQGLGIKSRRRSLTNRLFDKVVGFVGRVLD